MAIELTKHAAGWMIPVRAQPNAKANGIIGERDGALKVAVTAAPENGKANKAILDVIRKSLGVKRSQVELVSGEKSRDKRVLIRDVNETELRTRLASGFYGRNERENLF